MGDRNSIFTFLLILKINCGKLTKLQLKNSIENNSKNCGFNFLLFCVDFYSKGY